MSKDIYNKLVASFPPEAFSEDKSRGFALTSIKAQYVVERLNDTFGIEGWSAEYDFQKQDDNSVVSICTLSVTVGDKTISRVAVGGSDKKKQIADTYKSAMTDSLGKAASHLGLGNDVFKGLVNPDGSMKGSTVAKNTSKISSEPNKSVNSTQVKSSAGSFRKKKSVESVVSQGDDW